MIKHNNKPAIKIMKGIPLLGTAFYVHKSIIAVSYTHLDVYKRQFLYSPEIIQKFQSFFSPMILLK